MIRFLFTLTIYAAIGRFLYTEATLVAPFAKPAMDAFVKLTTIPPHTEWDQEKMAEYAEKVLPDSGWLKEIAPASATTALKKHKQLFSRSSDNGFKEL